MFEELGGLFGWLIVWLFAATILNYCIKFVNKKFGKKISANPTGKQIMKILMTIFVKNHKYFGFGTAVFLIAHFISQFTKFGFNITGCIAAGLMVLQVLLGIYANLAKRPRKGAWFILHRLIAILLILGIAMHLLVPNILNAARTFTPPAQTSTTTTTATAGSTESGTTTDATAATTESSGAASTTTTETSALPSFTADELSKYNGQNGNKAYVAYNGVVYDVTDVPQWKSGSHQGNKAGTDLTSELSKSPHGETVLQGLTVVGSFK